MNTNNTPGFSRFCATCKHRKRDMPWGFIFVPLIGWGVLLLWWLSGDSMRYAKCRIASIIIDNDYDCVTGKNMSKQHTLHCITARSFYGPCGPQGRNWEPKP